MFKHWMSKAQNNTSHFDKGAAHCDLFYLIFSYNEDYYCMFNPIT